MVCVIFLKNSLSKKLFSFLIISGLGLTSASASYNKDEVNPVNPTHLARSCLVDIPPEILNQIAGLGCVKALLPVSKDIYCRVSGYRTHTTGLGNLPEDNYNSKKWYKNLSVSKRFNIQNFTLETVPSFTLYVVMKEFSEMGFFINTPELTYRDEYNRIAINWEAIQSNDLEKFWDFIHASQVTAFITTFKNREVLSLLAPKLKDSPITHLKHGHNALDKSGMNALVKNWPKNLTGLDLSLARIGMAGARIFSPTWPDTLTFLDLTANDLNDTGVILMAQNWPRSLITLKLSSNDITDTGAIILSQNWPKKLSTLDISNNLFEKTGMIALAQNWPKNLTALDISEWDYCEEVIEVLAQNWPKNISDLVINLECGYQFFDPIAKILPNTLTSLEMSNYDSVKGFMLYNLAVNMPPNLTTLKLKFNHIDYLGIQILADSLPKTLTLLDISDNDMNGLALDHLLRKLPPHLVELDLSSNCLHDNDLDFLMEYIPPNLKVLSLYNNYELGENHHRFMVFVGKMQSTLTFLDLSEIFRDEDPFLITFTKTFPDNFIKIQS